MKIHIKFDLEFEWKSLLYIWRPIVVRDIFPHMSENQASDLLEQYHDAAKKHQITKAYKLKKKLADDGFTLKWFGPTQINMYWADFERGPDGRTITFGQAEKGFSWDR